MTPAVTVAEAAGRSWDAVIIGAGHNGLTAAAYLARAGRSVLVLERRAPVSYTHLTLPTNREV